jgi:hypothetical protein
MIAHDKQLLANTFFIEGAKSLRDGGFITTEQLNEAKIKTPRLKTNGNLLVRAGFFVLGCLLYSSIVGVISLFGFTIFENMVHYEWAIYSYALVGLAGSELLSREKFFGHGLDDAFVLGFLSMICLAIGINTESATATFIAMAIFGLMCCARYVNTISALVGLVGITGFFCCLSFDLGVIPKVYVPFIGLLLATAMFLFYHKIHAKPDLYFYKYAMQILQVFSLALGYASINYFVVRELSVELMDMVIAPGQDIPFAWVFYILTFAVPIGYLWYALQIKSKEMLWIGALALGCSVMTIRHYYSIMPPETALILAGIALFAVAYLLIRKLRHRESGITFERDRHSDKNTLLYAQAILVNSQVSVKPAESITGDMPFGGGGFSGGGAGETY